MLRLFDFGLRAAFVGSLERLDQAAGLPLVGPISLGLQVKLFR
jgi:hypothetical protein